MVLFPDVQRRAQKELDEVVGRDRLPSISDKTSGRLQYIEAVVKETLRWNSVAPLGAAHACTEEDQYMGYRIPKGAIVMANIWHGVSSFSLSELFNDEYSGRQIAHDPDTYDDPQAFKPERFLGSDVQPDPLQYSFGYGRRWVKITCFCFVFAFFFT